MITEEQEFIAKLKKEGFSSAQAFLFYKNRFKQNYAQQGYNNLNNKEALEVNEVTGVPFTPEFAKSGYFVTEQELQQQEKEKLFSNKLLAEKRKFKITDITSESQSPFANRRIWHDKKPEYYLGKKEVREGFEYTTIPYGLQWDNYKKSPEYLKYKGIQESVVAYKQFGGYAQMGLQFNPFLQNYNSNIDLQSQSLSPQQDFSLKNQDYQMRAFTPAQPYSNFKNKKFESTQQEIDDAESLRGYTPNVGNEIKIDSQITEGSDKNTINTSRKLRRMMSEDNQDNNSRLNVINPFGGVSLEGALATAGQGFGEKDPYKVGVGSALFAVKGTRNFLQGYGTGKVNKETNDNYYKNLYKDDRTFQALGQQGGIKNSEVIASRAITDEGQGNTNLENNEFVKRNNGLVQPVVGEPHIKNGKIAEGVDAQLNQGDKVLSDFIKLRAKDIKELKEQYKISLKVGDTPAKALKKIETKIGLTKETSKLATLAEGLEKVMKIKDATTKELSLETFKILITTQNEKINSLKQLSAVAFENVFEMQEEVPKQGNGSQLFDDKGKVVIEKNEGVMQQGGVMDMASKYGISKERAEELISMQMGGEMEQQPQAMSQEQMQPEVSQEEQIMQMIIQALQGGAQPEQIVEQLISMGLPEEQAAQAVQMVMEQSQEQPQMEQPTQERIPQEETVMQSGGKVYAQQSFFTPSKYVKPTFGNQPYQAGMTTISGDVNDTNVLKERMLYQDEVLPYVRQASGYEKGGYGTNLVGDFQTQYDNYVNATLGEIDNNEYLSDEDKKQYKETASKQLLGISNKKGTYDKIYGDETSSRTGFYLPYLTKKDREKYGDKAKFIGNILDEKGKVKEDFKDLDDKTKKAIEATYVRQGSKSLNIGLSDIKSTETAKKEIASGTTPQESSKQVDYVAPKTRNVIPNLPENLRLFPSGIPLLRKAEINLERMQPIKATVAPYMQSQATQQLTNREQMIASGLAPQIQQAFLASSGATDTMASNDAISKVENYNRQNQFATDQFNIGQRAKEDITNEQFSQDYQDKMLGSIANTERDRNNYYIQTNLDNTNKWNAVNDANVINARNENYQINPGVGVEYTPSYTQNINNMNSFTMEQVRNMTDEQYRKVMSDQIAIDKKKAYNQQRTS